MITDSQQIQSGIYMWHNKITGRVLVGQTQNFSKRKAAYIGKLRRGAYISNKHFQRSWTKNGENAFEFIILERIAKLAFLTYFEQSYLNYYRTLPGGVYNEIGPADAPRRGTHISEIHKNQISMALKGIPKRDGFGEEISKRQLGVKLSPERVERAAAALRGRTLSEKHKVNISASLRGKQRPVEVLEPMWAAGTAHLQSSVERVDPITGEVKEYSSIKSVQDDGFSSACVSQVCRGLRDLHKRYFWQYIHQRGAI